MELIDLRDALRERLAVVGDRTLYERDPEAHLARLVEASTRVDDLARAMGPAIDPTLGHFLERQSYVKALEWLNANVK